MPWVSTCNNISKRMFKKNQLKPMVTYNNCTNALDLTELHVAQGTDGMFYKINVYVSITNNNG